MSVPPRTDSGLKRIRAVQCEPIGKVELNARPQACCAVRFVVAVDPICPQLHALEAVFEHADVARCNVGFPRDDGCGVCPAAVTAAVCEHRVCFARLRLMSSGATSGTLPSRRFCSSKRSRIYFV